MGFKHRVLKLTRPGRLTSAGVLRTGRFRLSADRPPSLLRKEGKYRLTRNILWNLDGFAFFPRSEERATIRR